MEHKKTDHTKELKDFVHALINGDEEKAEELLHDILTAKGLAITDDEKVDVDVDLDDKEVKEDEHEQERVTEAKAAKQADVNYDFDITPTHVDDIKVGDTIVNDGKHVKLKRADIKETADGYTDILGNDYRKGKTKVKRVDIKKAAPKKK